jgi:hypothetical protein
LKDDIIEVGGMLALSASKKTLNKGNSVNRMVCGYSDSRPSLPYDTLADKVKSIRNA